MLTRLSLEVKYEVSATLSETDINPIEERRAWNMSLWCTRTHDTHMHIYACVCVCVQTCICVCMPVFVCVCVISYQLVSQNNIRIYILTAEAVKKSSDPPSFQKLAFSNSTLVLHLHFCFEAANITDSSLSPPHLN